MLTTITIKRFGIGSVYKLFAIGLACGMIPLGLFFGVLAFFGAHTVTWNNEHLTGLSGLLGGPLIGVGITVMFTLLVGSVCVFGLWLFSLVRPLRISYKAPESDDAL